MTKERIGFNEVNNSYYKGMYQNEAYIKQCDIDRKIVSLIKIRASQINGCGYCLDMHHKDALAASEQIDRLYLLPAWKESPCYSDAEKAILHFTDILTQLHLATSDQIEEAYERINAFYAKQEIADIVLIICQINAWNRMAITFGFIPGSYEIK